MNRVTAARTFRKAAAVLGKPSARQAAAEKAFAVERQRVRAEVQREWGERPTEEIRAEYQRLCAEREATGETEHNSASRRASFIGLLRSREVW